MGLETLSTADDADKPAKRTNSSEPRSFRLPSLESAGGSSKPPERVVPAPVHVPEGVLWVNHSAAESAAGRPPELDKDDDKAGNGTGKKKKISPTLAVEPAVDLPPTRLEQATPVVPAETIVPGPRQPAEALDEVLAHAEESTEVEGATPVPAAPLPASPGPTPPSLRQEAFTYLEPKAELAAPFPSDEVSPAEASESFSAQEALAEPEHYAPEPLPSIEDRASDTGYQEASEAEPLTIPIQRHTTQSAAAGPLQPPIYTYTPKFNNAPDAPDSPPPPPVYPGPGGGGPPPPPNQPPGGTGFNLYPGGPGNPNLPPPPPAGPHATGGNFNAMPPSAVMPNQLPGATFNVAPAYAPNRVTHNADWPAWIVGLAGFISSRRTRRKLTKRMDKFEAGNKREHKDLFAAQQQFAHEQSRQANNISRLQTAPSRPNREQQQVQTRFEARTPMAEVINAEQQQREETIKQQQVELQPHEHVEQSAWHSIVVDEHGREVRGAMQYGEGFRRERQQEAITDRVSSAAGAGAALGTGAGVGATQSQSAAGGGTPQQYGPQPVYRPTPGVASQNPPPAPPTSIDAQHQLPAHAQDKRVVSGLAFWIMLAIIIAAFFVAAWI